MAKFICKNYKMKMVYEWILYVKVSVGYDVSSNNVCVWWTK